MEGVLLGFILLVLISVTIDFFYHYQFYKRSLFKQLYQSYLNYYIAIKRKSDLASTRFLAEKIGFHKLVYVKSPNPAIHYYALMIAENGVHMIIPDPIKQVENRPTATFQSCLKEIKRLYKDDFQVLQQNLFVYYLKSTEKVELSEQKIVYLSEQQLVSRIAQINKKELFSKNDINWLYGKLILNKS